MYLSPPFALTCCALLWCTLSSACSSPPSPPTPMSAEDAGREDMSASDLTVREPMTLRVATFNASLYRQREGELEAQLDGGADAQAKRVAQVLQHVRPDIVLINEFDHDADGLAARRFAEQYLAVSQGGGEPLRFEHWFVPETNTGQPSGVDLDNDGKIVDTPGSQAYGNDSYGFGTFPGQYGMVVFSRFPIMSSKVRTFSTLAWEVLPDTLLPTDWYSAEAAAVMRLSSKNHVDLPIEVDGEVLHALVSHPTPPSFDGPEDRNGRRNHDEVRLWVDYLTGGEAASYIRDDTGAQGGIEESARFVILGDLNSDPVDGSSQPGALRALLAHPRVQDTHPESEGAARAATRDGGANQAHGGAASQDTADFSDFSVGNLRVDYALPSANLEVEGSGVFWPSPEDEQAGLADVSDHHLVWVDVMWHGR